MDERNIVVGLDVGTTKVCTIIASQSEQSELEVIGVGTHTSEGLKKGSVVNIDKTVNSIHRSLEEARLMAGVDITSATVGIAGSHIYSFNSTGVVAVKDVEIRREDVARALDAAGAVVIPSDREILHVIPQEFRIDNTRGIKDPVGMCGVRLEVRVHIVTGAISLIQNLVKCVEQAGINVKNITLQPIASSRAALSPEEKEMGVVLVDIGGGTSDIAVWKNGNLVYSQIIPVGGDHFTGDLAVALKVPHNEAERIKVAHGNVLKGSTGLDVSIKVQGISGTNEREVGLGFIAGILGARAEELFGMVKNIMVRECLDDEVTGGIVLTGGGSLMKGLPVLGEYIMEKPTKVGCPVPFGGMTGIMQNPKFSTVLGLLLESQETALGNHESQMPRKLDIIGKLSGSLRSAFREIF